MDTTVIIYVRVGADLCPEPWDTSDAALRAALAEAQAAEGIDGGLDVVAEGTRISWPDAWDRVDAMLLAWLQALDAIAAGATSATALFPDTRIECELTTVGDNRLRIEYEDIDATVRLDSLHEQLMEAATRLVALARRTGIDTSATRRLAERWSLSGSQGDDGPEPR